LRAIRALEAAGVSFVDLANFIVEIGPTMRRIELYTTVIDRFQVNLAKGEEHEGICRRMEELSAEMGTKLERNDGRLCVEVAFCRGPRGRPGCPFEENDNADKR